MTSSARRDPETPARASRRAGRPVEPLLDIERITTAALASLDEVGDFTMAQLARRLGVGTSALYNHVAGKEEVLSRVREHVSDRIDTAVFDRAPFFDALHVWARSYRDAFALHPATIAVFATTPLDGARRTTDMYERVVTAFLAAGWPEDDVVIALVALENFILGAALDSVAPNGMFDLSDAGQAPALARVTAAFSDVLRDRRATDASFDAGMQAMLAGLRARLTHVSRSGHDARGC